MRINFATWLFDRSLGVSLTKHGARRRLVSYHFLKEQEITREGLSKYSKRGRLDTRKNKNVEEL